ncbi:MAG: redoxin domain-containing protein [Chloroflexi bacterium]|nr:redoxin domain-containing protein [Chloroflexota bacterium]MCC6892600.1 redoxin domain-containing protein [Anaerolineae bacterium]
MTQTTTKLMAGMAAPIFQSPDLFDRPINLADYHGRWLLLSFYRNAACALCNLRVHELIAKYPEYEAKGLDMLAVFESPRANMGQYVGKQDAPFPLIADPEARLYDLYGVETSESKVQATMAAPDGQARVQAAAAAGFALTKEEGSNFYRIPADFLIDPEGIIREAFYSDLIGQHLSLEVIDEHLRTTVL